MRARFSDGQSATARAVTVKVVGDVLVIEAPTGNVSWPLATLRRLETTNADEVALSTDVVDGARLTIARNEADSLLSAAPHVTRARSRMATFWLTVPLVLAAVALAGLVFFGLPILSGPLARAVPPAAEMQIGAQADAFVHLFANDCSVDSASQDVLDDLASRLNAVAETPFNLRITLVDATFPNAFALPGGSIIVTDELIDIMKTPEELAGVLAHETAHVARRHAMAAMLREIGYGLVLDLVLGGGSGAGQQIAMAGSSLESLRHSRSAEAEADELALVYLEAAGIDGTGLAQFFEGLNKFLAKEESGDFALSYPELLSTHPDTIERAQTARANAGRSRSPALSPEDWALIENACGSPPAEDAPAAPTGRPAPKPQKD